MICSSKNINLNFIISRGTFRCYSRIRIRIDSFWSNRNSLLSFKTQKYLFQPVFQS